MNPIATYLAPPLLGAFIGYMTNYVAIRMLFRPLKPWYIFGLRVPMTPGVIPLKRKELAENIGEMVGGHLLTSNDVSQALGEEGFRHELRQLIDGRMTEILDRPLGPVPSIVPERFRSYFKVGIKILRWRTLKHLHSHIRSDAFAEQITPAISSHLQAFLSQPLDEIISEKSRDELQATIEAGLANFLGSDGVEQWVRDTVSSRVETFIAEDRSLNDLLPEGLKTLLLDRLEAETPHLIHKLAKLLQEPLVQDRIARGITNAVGTFAANLGPLGGLLGGFLNPETIGQKVREYLEGKGEDIAQWLFDETVQQKVAIILRNKAEGFLAAPASQFLDKLTPETMPLIRDGLADQAMVLLHDPATAKAVANLAREALETQQKRPLQEIIGDLFGDRNAEKAINWTATEVITLLRSATVRRLLDKVVIDLIENRLLQAPVGKLSDFLPKEVQHGISDYLLQQVSNILVREVPGLVDTLNIRRLVARKVNTLDLLRLEGLLLSIMEEQFKYINLFGALLGFMIGLLNLIFLLST
ncbi:MAG: DUF445 family protein [Desulfobulbaceae bacterium]|nr:DUF445 family protein [Desulfobulbaceae bacterium]